MNHVLPAWDLITGQMAAVGLLAAERHRSRTGQGQHVKLALEDVGLAVMSHLGFIAEAQLGVERERHGNALFGAFGQDFVCADGVRVMVVGLTTKQWTSLVEATGTEAAIRQIEDIQGVDLRREGQRFLMRDAIAKLIAPWIAARTCEAVAAEFNALGVCWNRYQSVRELANGPSVRPDANPLFARILQP